jgi:hypothetical protein
VIGSLPVHVPPWQASTCVQALPSLQLVPLAAAGFEQLPVLGLHVPATWHESEAEHVTGLEPTQLPALQAYVWLHRSVPVHAVPSGLGAYEHPVWGLHVGAAWHCPVAGGHVTGLEPVHVPAWHVSPWVHALPSLQVVPLATVGFEHVPVLGLHVPAAWHWSLAAQVTWLPAVHTPAWQLSSRSHALPSLHAVPLLAAGFEQVPVPGSQVPAVWHASLAVHVTWLPAVQAPAWQVSFRSHALPSLHDVPFATVGFEQAPELGSHVPAAWH